MFTAAELAAFRRDADELMTDTCRIDRPAADPSGVFDPATGEYGPGPMQQLYVGRCRVKPTNAGDRVVDVAGETLSLLPYVVSVPVSLIEFDVDDVVTVTAAAHDPGLVDLELRVRQPQVGSQLTARRLGCEVRR